MKYKLLFFCATILCLFSACQTDYNDYRVFVHDSATITPEGSMSSVKLQTPESVDNEASMCADAPDWQRIYTAFLTESYHQLMDICTEGIAGVGFIDLDIDSVPELVVFDYGTTAMGVQIFDIIYDEVVCITSSASEVGDFFDSPYLLKHKIATGLFENFRLMVNPETGMRIFIVESAAMTTDSDSGELIIFSSSNDALFLLNAEECGISRQFLFEVFSDTGYDATGTFIWEKISYSEGFTGFMSMVENSLKGYIPLPEDSE